jgi:hypothetical protein
MLVFVFGAAALDLLVTQCGGDPCSGVVTGTPCSESQTNVKCPDPGSPCAGLICDGTQFGPFVVAPGDACTQLGLTCPASTGDECASPTLVCTGARFQIQQTMVGPGVACRMPGQVCLFPGTECQTCTCNGTAFVCEDSACCTIGCNDGGTCPSPELVVAGYVCQSTLACTSNYACGNLFMASGLCTCSAGVWTCQASCGDAGGDASSDAASPDGD